ncbi:MAG: hypothetical protein ACT4NY_34115 [Pseudonocardiales bacterium]
MTITRNEHTAGDHAVRVTSARDGREHLVAQKAMTPGSAGQYPALCGLRVWAAALACPAGLPCRACFAVGAAYPADACRRRQRQTGVRAWLNRLRRRARAAESASLPDTARDGTGVREARHED